MVEPTLPALNRIRQYLRSAGRYGATPFLVGHYGGLGETAQGFCRTSAVKGGTYILGRRVVDVKPPSSAADSAAQDEKSAAMSSAEPRYSVVLEDFDEPLTAKILLASPDYVSSGSTVTAPTSSHPSVPSSVYPVARCIAIVDKPLSFTPSEYLEEPPPTEADPEDAVEGDDEKPSAVPAAPSYEVDTAVLVFPPGSLANGSSTSAAHVLVTGEGSLSAPRGKCELIDVTRRSFPVKLTVPRDHQHFATSPILYTTAFIGRAATTIPRRDSHAHCTTVGIFGGPANHRAVHCLLYSPSNNNLFAPWVECRRRDHRRTSPHVPSPRDRRRGHPERRSHVLESRREAREAASLGRGYGLGWARGEEQRGGGGEGGRVGRHGRHGLGGDRFLLAAVGCCGGGDYGRLVKSR